MKKLVTTFCIVAFTTLMAAGQIQSTIDLNLLEKNQPTSLLDLNIVRQGLQQPVDGLAQLWKIDSQIHGDTTIDVGFWKRDSFSEYEYSPSGQIVAIQIFKCVDGVTVPDGRIEFKYNDDNLLLIQQDAIVQTDSSYSINRVDFEYDEFGFNTLQTISFLDDTVSTSNPRYRYHYQPDSLGRLSGICFEQYDSTSIRWGKVTRQTFGYNDNNTLINSTLDFALTDSTFFPRSRVNYTLNGSDLPIQIDQDIWNGIAWNPFDRITNVYEVDFLGEKIYSTWFLGDSLPTLISKNEYDQFQRNNTSIETDESFKFLAESQTWQPTSFQRNYYNADSDIFYQEDQLWDVELDGYFLLGSERSMFTYLDRKPVFEPELRLPDDSTFHAGGRFSLRIGLMSAETPDVTLTTAPAGMTIDETGLIDWPAATQGAHDISVHAVNPSGFADLDFVLNIDVSTPNENGEVARAFTLNQNYPNPFNPTTQIQYNLIQSGHASIKIYDVTGRLVKTLVDGIQPAGAYSVNFNAEGLASGTYFYHLSAGGQVLTHKMVLLR